MSSDKYMYREPRWPQQQLTFSIPGRWPRPNALPSEIEQDLVEFIRVAGPKERNFPYYRSGHASGEGTPAPQFVPAYIRVLWVQKWRKSLSDADQSIPISEFDWYSPEWYSNERRLITIVWEPVDCEENRRQRFEGKVYEWFENSAYGFLKCPECPKVFLHISEVPARYREKLRFGSVWKFSIVDTGKGPAATNVEFVESQ